MLCFSQASFSESPTIEARKIVQEAYNQILIIFQNPDNLTVVGDARVKFARLFPTIDFWLPDEFKYMNSGTGGFKLRIPNYIGIFGKLVQNKKISDFKYNIISAEEIEGPNFLSQERANFIQVIAKKEYRYLNKNIIFSDTLVVDVDSKKIVMFENEARCYPN